MREKVGWGERGEWAASRQRRRREGQCDEESLARRGRRAKGRMGQSQSGRKEWGTEKGYNARNARGEVQALLLLLRDRKVSAT